MTKKLTTLVTWRGLIPAVMGSVMILDGYNLSPVNPTKGVIVSRSLAFSIPICSKVDKYRIFVELLLLTRTLVVQRLAMTNVITRALS